MKRGKYALCPFVPFSITACRIEPCCICWWRYCFSALLYQTASQKLTGVYSLSHCIDSEVTAQPSLKPETDIPARDGQLINPFYLLKACIHWRPLGTLSVSRDDKAFETWISRKLQLEVWQSYCKPDTTKPIHFQTRMKNHLYKALRKAVSFVKYTLSFSDKNHSFVQFHTQWD